MLAGAGLDQAHGQARTDAAAAKSSCGANCGRFTALNEAAGLVLSPDILFRFRQTAKPLADPIAKEDWERVRGVLPRLRELMDRALSAPGTGPAGPLVQQAAKEGLSERLDRFSETLRSGGDRAAAYAAMMEALERAYDAVL